jgi:hypothetical protein
MSQYKERAAKTREIEDEFNAFAARMTERYGELFAANVTVQHRAGVWPAQVSATFTVQTEASPTKEQVEGMPFPVSPHGIF